MPRRFPETGPVRRRFTARGVCVLAMALGLFLMGTHFSNNIVFLIAFLLLGLAGAAVLSQWNALSGARARLTPPALAVAGAPAQVRFTVEGRANGFHVTTALGRAEGLEDLVLALPRPQRGQYRIGPARLCAADPFGLFVASRDLGPAECASDAVLTVYPAPDWAAPAPASATASPASIGRTRGEMAGLRPYRPGDPPGDISWRHSARVEGLLVKEYEADPRQGARRYDWSAVAERGVEPALSALSAAVLTAARDGVPAGLDLPGQSLAAGHSPVHLAEALGALAAYREAT